MGWIERTDRRVNSLQCVIACGLLLHAAAPARAQQTLFPGRQFFATDNPIDPHAADFNGDGIVDIAVASASSSHTDVVVILGTGAAGFGSPTSYPTGSTSLAISLAMADLDGDGKLDLVTSHNQNQTDEVFVMLGNGAGGFSPGAGFTTGAGTQPRAVEVGDLNVDGRLDLVTANSAGSASVLFGLPAGGFSPPSIY